MRVILFRHGPAGKADASRWPDDGKRPLTKRGLERTTRAADGLRRFLGRAGRVIASPLERARQTARIVSETFVPAGKVETLDALAPGVPLRETLRWLKDLKSGASVVMVGHEPHLGKLGGALLFGSAGATLPLKKGGVAVIDFVGPVEPGSGRLYAFLPPRALRRLSHSKAGA
jgi:phosphohistidine phosphatase